MKLKDLLEGLQYKILQGTVDQGINELVVDSRKASKKDLFVCIKGAASDGHRYIKQAVKQGATAVLLETVPENIENIGQVAFIQIDNTRKALAILAAKHYGHPAKELKLIGITGTKGKTTTACMIKAVLEEAGYKTGMIGTMGVFYGEVTEKTPNTTPDALALHRIFREMKDSGCSHVVMEASSQGFKQYRTAGLTFDYGLFLNIGHDHIGENEHADFREYLACKKQLFKQSKKMIVNVGNRLWEELTEAERQRSITFSTNGNADYYSTGHELIRGTAYLGSAFEVNGQLKRSTHLSIAGQYNIENALAAIALANQLGIPETLIFETLQRFQVEGRTQFIKAAAKYRRTVLVDYAHNGMSMESVLKALKAYHPRRLICVFGMRWDETKMRRYDMGAAAGKYADRIILTEDNIGPETLESINADIIQGIEDSQGKYVVIPDRKTATTYALDYSDKQDIVILIGKGHERYQEVNGKKVYFSERDIVVDHLKRKKRAGKSAAVSPEKKAVSICGGLC